MDLYSLSSSFTPTFASSSSSSSSPHIVITGNDELAQHGDMIELRDLRQHAIYCGSSLDRSAIIRNNENGDIFNCADEVLHIPSTTILNLESSTSLLDPIHFAKNGLNVTWNLTCIDEEEESNSNDERCEALPQSDTKHDSTSCKVRDKKKKKNKKQSPSPCFRSIHDGAISLNDIDSALSMSAELIENYRGTHSKIYYNASLLDTYIPTLLSKLQHLLDEQIIATTTTSQKKKSLVTTPVAFRMSMSLPNKQPKPKKQKWSFSFFSFKSFPFYKFWKNTNNETDNNDKGGGESKNDNISIRDRLRRTMNETAPYKWIVRKIDETSSIFSSSVKSIPNNGINETDSTINNKDDVITKNSDSSLNIAYHFIHEKVNYMIELTGFYLSFLFQIFPLVSSLSYYYEDQTEHPPPPNARGGDSHSAATTSTSSTSSCEYIMNDMAFSKDFEYLTSVFISGEKDFSGGNMVFADYDVTTEEEGEKPGSTNDSSENINNNNKLERGLVVDGSLGRTVISSGGLENKRCVLPIREGIRVVLQVWWKQN